MNQIPGQLAGATRTNRDFLRSGNGVIQVQGVIDAANSYDGVNTSYERELRPGTIMAQITSSKKWVPCKRTKANGAGSTATALTVYDARSFKTTDTIKVGSNNTCAISSINYSTNVITLAATKTWSDGDAVYCDSSAGSEIARAVLNEWVNLLDYDGVARDKTTGRLVIAGLAYSGVALGDLTNILAATNYLTQIAWDNQQGVA